MNQRRSDPSRNTGTYVAVIVVVVALVVGLVYWFALRDDDASEAPSDQPVATARDREFIAPGASFSFTYPGAFEVKTGEEAQGFVLLAGIGPYDVINVKRLANEPTSVDKLRSSTRQVLETRPDVTILGDGTTTQDGITMVTFEVQSQVEELTLLSRLYYFTANKVTWQIECGSQAKRVEVETACAQVLATFAGP